MGAEGFSYAQGSTPGGTRLYYTSGASNSTHSFASQTAATNYFNALLPWGGVGRVSLRPDGSVASRCNLNTTAFQSGDNCYSDTDDTGNEQKMVYVPQCCTLCDTSGANINWWVGLVGDSFYLQSGSLYTFTTADIHPAFIVDGKIKSGVYISAYEAYYNSALGILESKAGVAPTVSTAKSTLRGYANAIGAGWELCTMQIYGLMQYLETIELGTLYNTNVWDGVLGLAPLINTGYTALNGTYPTGNASWGAPYASAKPTPMAYRGVESLIGNTDTIVEGIRTDTANGIWVAQQYSIHNATGNTYTDSSTLTPTGTGSAGTVVGPYVKTGVVVPAIAYQHVTAVFTTTGANGLSFCFLPSVGGGAGGTYYCDLAAYSSPGASNVCAMGGGAGSAAGPNAGLYTAMIWSGSPQVYIGTRLCYLPQ